MRTRLLIQPHLVLAGALAALVLMASFEVAAQADTLGSGEFTGRSGHVTTGGVQVVRTDSGIAVVLADDFSLDGAPDPKVGFGRDGQYDAQAQLGHLESTTGAQTYAVSPSIDVGRYNEVYIWCEQFSVLISPADLKPAAGAACSPSTSSATRTAS